MNDLAIGKKALQYFFEASKSYSAFKFKSFDEFYSVYGKKADIYAEGIGLAVRVNDMSDSKVKSTMYSLAKTTQGRVPNDHQAYVSALGSQAGQINYLDLTLHVAKDVSDKALDGAQAVGNSVIKSLDWLTTLLPFIAVGGVIFWVYSIGNKNSTVSDETKRDIKDAFKKMKARVAKK